MIDKYMTYFFAVMALAFGAVAIIAQHRANNAQGQITATGWVEYRYIAKSPEVTIDKPRTTVRHNKLTADFIPIKEPEARTTLTQIDTYSFDTLYATPVVLYGEGLDSNGLHLETKTRIEGSFDGPPVNNFGEIHIQTYPLQINLPRQEPISPTAKEKGLGLWAMPALGFSDKMRYQGWLGYDRIGIALSGTQGENPVYWVGYQFR